MRDPNLYIVKKLKSGTSQKGQNTIHESLNEAEDVHVDLWAAISDHKMRDNWSVNGWVRNN